MAIDFGRLRVSRLIVHEIPGKIQDDNQSPILSTVETALSNHEKRYFTRKIIENLALASLSAQFMPETESPIPQLIVNDFFRSNNHEFVQLSQKMANYLYECQTRVNSPGLLAVIEVSIAKKPALAILKLEKEEGMRIEQENKNGQVSFNVEYISNILLSEKNKVFKAGLFFLDSKTIALKNIDVYISDNQNNRNSNSKIASFFLDKFLGCQLKDEPNVITKKFFQQTESFINHFVEDPEEQTTYSLALAAELKSGDRYLEPESFSDKYLKLDKKQLYLDHLEQADIPTHKFSKDIELIKNHLSKIQIVLDSGITILSPATAFQEQLKLSNRDNGQVHIEIEDKLKQLKGK